MWIPVRAADTLPPTDIDAASAQVVREAVPGGSWGAPAVNRIGLPAAGIELPYDTPVAPNCPTPPPLRSDTISLWAGGHSYELVLTLGECGDVQLLLDDRARSELCRERWTRR